MHHFGFLLFDRLEELDLVGPWEMINIWGKKFNGPQSIFTVSEREGVIQCDNGLRIVSDYTFENCPPLDYLLVPGGMGTRTEVYNPALIDFIRTQAQHCTHILSVCTGSFLLYAAGLLKDRTVTTHWASIERLKQFSDIHVQEERYIKDGNIWTSAGISAGTDMALAFIADHAGREIAAKVQLQTEYFPDTQSYLDENQHKNMPGYLAS